MKLPPPSVLKTWPKPNYINPESRGNALVVLNGVFLGVMTITLGLRLYTRLIVKRWFGWDDGFIICAYVWDLKDYTETLRNNCLQSLLKLSICTVLMTVTVALGSERYGWNRHAWDIPLSMGKTSFHVAFYAKLCFLFAGFFTAQSLLSFYYRLIQESSVKWFRTALHCSVTFNLLAWLPLVFTEIFICVPTYAYWSFPEPAGSRCLNEGPVTIVGGLVKIAVDILITTLPIPLIMRMNMQKKQRYMVSILLGLGYIVCIAGAVRAYYTWKAFYNTNDTMWYEYPAFIASGLENNLAIICACIPTIRPLFPHLFGGPVSRIKNWMSSKTSSNPISNPDKSGSYNSRQSKTRSRNTSINKHSISAPLHYNSGSGGNRLIITQTESFELTEKSITDDDPRFGSGGFSNPDYFHFGPRYDERTGFHAV